MSYQQMTEKDVTPTNNNDSAYKKTSENINKNSNNFFTGIKSTVSTNESLQSDQQQQQQPQAPKTFVDGVFKGLVSIGSGIINGTKGVVVEPYRGAKREGVAGFAKGVAKGVGGVVLLPVVGVMEFVSMTTQGIMNTPLTVIEAMKNAPKEETMELTSIEHCLFFGISLEESILRCKEKGVPHLITICLEFLTLRVNHEGIFRLSGSKTEIDKFQTQFDKGEINSVGQLDSFKVNEIAGLFKQYFRFTPDPIVPKKTIKKLMEIQSKPADQNEKISALKHGVCHMDEPYYSVLYRCTELLTKIAENSKESLMTPSNLSIVFGVSWLRPENELQQIADANTVVFHLISNFPQIFTKKPSVVL
ncbi:RhoGAP domain-containing protein [Heterostelium album PN500]|uniref:RhoGAP domain-containing protein n=1 Tax=Heterostelium pallidum (strain ATCC 26659 / Pp 5 / PN500) TaxID=670386 RepID=D3AWJ4_HETP5|nr:RhoGAP domain-containing protein [Heterostelium album PN500]EFA86667.1 RhoGAP domain-containing protein [Heterostelium album PN500]|eukprot:XP_020438771.1 RhoGAP domain-containing protein [Heterostelium album PN500]